MIERKFISEKVKERQVVNFIEDNIERSSYSHATLLKTPLGMKVVIHTSKPGLIVGQGGQNIRRIQSGLVKLFGFENPLVEVNEVRNSDLNAQIMSARIGYQLTRWGVQRFKKIGYNVLEKIMSAGAKGAEVSIRGKVPGKRATAWNFRAGFLPKTGSVSDYDVDKGFTEVVLKPGVIGITVQILRSDVIMPDFVEVLSDVAFEAKVKPVKKTKIVMTKEAVEVKETKTVEKEAKKEKKIVSEEKEEKKAKQVEKKKEDKKESVKK